MDRLAITTAPQTILANTCSAPLTVETRNALNQLTTVSTSTQVGFAAVGGGLGFFQDSTCSMATSSATIAAGSATATVYFRSALSGSSTVNPTSAPLLPASQLETIVPPPTSLAFSSAAPMAPILAGLCFQATVQARSVLGPVVLTSPAPVSLQATPLGGLRFYSNATCTTAVTSATILSGQSTASFYVKTITGGGNTLTATASFGTAVQSFTVNPVVRRGLCSFVGANPQVICPITPVHQSLGRTMVMYQVGSSSTNPVDSEVKCKLLSVDLLTCERVSGSASVTISWQTAELISGLAVQRFAAPTCPASPTLLPLSPAVNPASSFVLSSFSGIGTNYDGDDMSTARLSADGGTLQLDNISGQACTGYETQVVELSGVSTLRGATSGFNANIRQLNVTGLPAASTNTVLFNQTLGDGAIVNSTSMCNLFVRSELSSPTSLLFSRGADNPSVGACSWAVLGETAWERVDFGSRGRVQAFTVTITASGLDVPIVSVDTTRSLIFSGGQMSGGQATGETAGDNLGEDNIGMALARFDFGSDTLVRVTRGRNQSTSTFTFYVVELEP